MECQNKQKNWGWGYEQILLEVHKIKQRKLFHMNNERNVPNVLITKIKKIYSISFIDFKAIFNVLYIAPK